MRADYLNDNSQVSDLDVKIVKVTADVYRVKNNKPILIGIVWWNTASCRGDKSEVMNFLVEQKEIPKKNYGYYHNAQKNFRIFVV